MCETRWTRSKTVSLLIAKMMTEKGLNSLTKS